MPLKQIERNDDDRLNWRYQDKTYNEMFKAWRKQRKDSIGFYYVSNPNELTYLDGYGFVTDYPEAAERSALRRVMNVIGVTMMILGMIDIFYKFAVPELLSMLGADIYYDRYAKAFYGNEWLILGFDTFFSIIKRIIPLAYVCRMMRMPVKVMVPTKITNRTLFGYSIPIMLFTAGCCMAASGLYGRILRLMHIEKNKLFEMPDSKAVLVLFLILHIIIIPIISEIHTRGALLQLLRQFGDGFAIVVTALLTALITYNLNTFCYMFVSALVIGYFTVRTGSVITAVLMRITTVAVSYGIFAMSEYLDEDIRLMVSMASTFVILLVGTIGFVKLMIKDSGSFALNFKSRYLTFSDKCGIVASSIPVVVGLTVIIIHTIINISFTVSL